MISRKCLLLLALIFAVTSAAAEKQYGPGVTDTEIKIGQTVPYSGPASALSAIAKAQAAYFAKINAEGGIRGGTVAIWQHRQRNEFGHSQVR